MTDIVREIEEKKRSSVVVMESGERFWITRSQMAEREPIRIGQEIDTDELRQWLLPRQYPMALNNAVELLAQRAHASGEIAQKLRRRLYMEDTIEMVLYKLEKERLLDDEAFARDWAASRARSQMGKSRIRQELRMKGISAEMAEIALEELDEEESEDAAVALARKLLRRYSREADERKAMQKLLMAMARRGYGYEESRNAVETALNETDE
ncbi:MAG: RecX family transcriptional regulator [Clostridia bacterium]|nr:RecX family transcriptional regulator [Selenomonadales bacterium]MBP3645978.1 RecX family transcriptional regulator [Clostridia bacterium]